MRVAQSKREQHPHAPILQSELHPGRMQEQADHNPRFPIPCGGDFSEYLSNSLIVLHEALLSSHSLGLQQHPLGRNHEATERSGVLPAIILVDSVLVCLVRSGL